MRYQQKFTSEEHKNWLRLEVTIGTNQVLIEKEEKRLSYFLNNLDNLQKKEFEEITKVPLDSGFIFKVKDKVTLRALLLKTFINNIGLEIIKEAREGIGKTEEEIYIALLNELVADDKFPDDIFAYSIYRQRGTPVSWIGISKKISPEEAKSRLIANQNKIINSVAWRMGINRSLVLVCDINDLTLLLISKPTGAKVIRGERKNIEVSGASYTIIVLDRAENSIGVVSGSKKEISSIFSVLRKKVYKDALAPPRNDIEVKGKEIIQKLLKNNAEDSLLLQTLELNKTSLPGEPSLKLRVKGEESLDKAIETGGFLGSDVSISDLRLAEFLFVGRKKIGIYTFGDDWERLCVNTATRKITSELELAFLQQIADRIDGIDIKKSRLILDDLTVNKIVNKLLKDRKIMINPPIPEKAEQVLVNLVKMKLLSRSHTSTQRVCFNCWTRSWDQWLCPNCDRTQSEMRLVGEEMRIELNEQSVIRNIRKFDLGADKTVKYQKRQRSRYSKQLLEVHNKSKNITVCIVLAQTNRDISFLEALCRETMGVVAIVDPKISKKIDAIENAGASVVELTDVLVALLEESSSEAVKDMIEEQEQKVLEMIYGNARLSLNSLKNKTATYDERNFEVDIKNIFQALVPEVMWLGAKYSGRSVPDGYLQYGSRQKRVLGWDAKYSLTSKYRLNSSDAAKQKKYIDWLMETQGDPRKLGKLGIYAIISNFDDIRRMKTALKSVSNYEKLPPDARVAIIEDGLLTEVCEWVIEHWKQSIDNGSVIANEVFGWLRRKQTERYTVSSKSDWPRLKNRLETIIGE